MTDSTRIVLQKNIPLSRRLQEVKKRISLWSHSLERPYDGKADAIRLVRVERTKDDYAYSYVIERGVNRGGR